MAGQNGVFRKCDHRPKRAASRGKPKLNQRRARQGGKKKKKTRILQGENGQYYRALVERAVLPAMKT